MRGRNAPFMGEEMLASLIHTYYLELLAILPILLLLTGLLFAVGIDPYIQKAHKKTLLVLLGLVFSLIVQNYGDYLLCVGKPNVMLRRVVASCGYVIRPIVLLLFLYIVQPRKKHAWAWCLAGVNAALHIVSIFTPLCFTIDENNLFVRGIVGFRYFCALTSLTLLGVLLIRTLKGFQPAKRKETWIPIFVTLLILLGLVLDENVGSMAQPVSFLTIAIVIGCALFYNWLHLQFVREHEEALEADQRIQIMLSQIKPHFLCNSLGAIEEMCDSDPKKAKETTAKFARYLRGNMDSLSAKGTIPFEKELAHTRLYLDMEQIRFEDALQVRYEIQCTDFEVPTLTLQPLAENAVRHGVRENADGRGRVTIGTREYADRYEVFVADDGPGFDAAHAPKELGHVGIENVRGRLGRVCGGTLEIHSAPGKGTTAVMMIPKEGKGNAAVCH